VSFYKWMLTRRHLSRTDLRALGASPGLNLTRYDPDDGRARFERIVPDEIRGPSKGVPAPVRQEVIRYGSLSGALIYRP